MEESLFYALTFFFGLMAISLTSVASTSFAILIRRYQKEKPNYEKSTFDCVYRDTLAANVALTVYAGLSNFIGILIPPCQSPTLPYVLSTFGYTLYVFVWASIFITLYINHIYTFQPESTVGVQEFKLRWKSIVWKLFLTIFTLLMDVVLGPFQRRKRSFGFTMFCPHLSYDSVIGLGIGSSVLLTGIIILICIYCFNLRSLDEMTKMNWVKHCLVTTLIITMLLICLYFSDLLVPIDVYKSLGKPVSIFGTFSYLSLNCYLLYFRVIKANPNMFLYVKNQVALEPEILPWQYPETHSFQE